MRTLILLFCALSHLSVYASNNYEWNISIINKNAPSLTGTFFSNLDSSTYINVHTEYSYPYTRSIAQTKDYGISWDTLYHEEMDDTYTDYYQFGFTDVEYVDDSHIIALFGNKKLLKSNDAGNTWQIQSPFDDTFSFRNIESKDNLVILGGNNSDLFAISTDFGDTWSLKSIELDTNYLENYDNITALCPKMFSNTMYTMVYLQKKIQERSNLDYISHCLLLRSYDYGNSWEEVIYLDSDFAVQPYFVISNNQLYGQSVEYDIEKVKIKNRTGGTDTAYVYHPFYNIISIDLNTKSKTKLSDSLNQKKCSSIKSISKFEDKLFVCTVSDSYVSSDGGYNWIKEKKSPEDFERLINTVLRLSPTRGIMAGQGFFATLQPTTSVTEQNKTLQYLHLYPNPAAPGSKINLEFDATETGEYSFKLSSMDGRNIDLMQNDFFSKGRVSKSIELNSNLTAGTYVLSVVKSGEIVSRSKFIVQ